MRKRPNKRDYYMNIAKAVSQRSTCLRRQYGAVIVKNDRIIATGYNGAPRGFDNCCDLPDCPRKRENVPHGQQYERCKAIHAEENALLSAGKEAEGAILYLYGYDLELEKEILAIPCMMCDRIIHNSQIDRVISHDPDKKEYQHYLI